MQRDGKNRGGVDHGPFAYQPRRWTDAVRLVLPQGHDTLRVQRAFPEQLLVPEAEVVRQRTMSFCQQAGMYELHASWWRHLTASRASGFTVVRPEPGGLPSSTCFRTSIFHTDWIIFRRCLADKTLRVVVAARSHRQEAGRQFCLDP